MPVHQIQKFVLRTNGIDEILHKERDLEFGAGPGDRLNRD
jgi:hypothetical protein